MQRQQMASGCEKLFVGGIPWEADEEKLIAYFSTFGEVVDAVIMKDKGTGRNRGFGFVSFADPAVADRVLVEKLILNGRRIEAKRATPRDEYRNSARNVLVSRTKKIFVGGLPSTITEEYFKNYFSQFGTINDVVVMYDPVSRRSRGFGFITFDLQESVENVVKDAFHELQGKRVEVKKAVPRELSARTGYRGTERRTQHKAGHRPDFGLMSKNMYGGVPTGRWGFPAYSMEPYMYGGAGYAVPLNSMYAGTYPGAFPGPGMYVGYGVGPIAAPYGDGAAYLTPYASAPVSPWGNSGFSASSSPSPLVTNQAPGSSALYGDDIGDDSFRHNMGRYQPHPQSN